MAKIAMARVARAMQCGDVARWADLTANVEVLK
jgi:hypothetical protein